MILRANIPPVWELAMKPVRLFLPVDLVLYFGKGVKELDDRPEFVFIKVDSVPFQEVSDMFLNRHWVRILKKWLNLTGRSKFSISVVGLCSPPIFSTKPHQCQKNRVWWGFHNKGIYPTNYAAIDWVSVTNSLR